jgi:hypothetical protein
MNNCIKVLNNIWCFARTYLVTSAGILGILWGIFTFYDKKQDAHSFDSATIHRLDSAFKQFSIMILDSIGKISDEVQTIKPIIRTTNDRISKLTTSQNNLKAYMMEKAATKQDVIDILNIFEKKNDLSGN